MEFGFYSHVRNRDLFHSCITITGLFANSIYDCESEKYENVTAARCSPVCDQHKTVSFVTSRKLACLFVHVYNTQTAVERVIKLDSMR